MSEFDAIVVGARCAGATLAATLARRGKRVALIDRTDFPSDTLSTHVFQGGAIEQLADLGVLDRVLGTGAPAIRKGRIEFRNGDDRFAAEVPMPSRDGLPPMMCVRRVELDAILAEAAEKAGAELRSRTSVTSLVEDGDRVRGVRIKRRDGGGEDELHAPVVVGADGRSSTVAGAVGAERYAVMLTERFGYFAYYEGIDTEARLELYRDERLYGFGVPIDRGLYLACVMLPAAEYADFMADHQLAFDDAIAGLGRIGEIASTGSRTGKPRGLRSVDTYLRQAAGPGWALVGDAGHFKDPSPGQGIADAMRQARRLAEAIAAPGDELDSRLADYWRWRDRDARARHTWAHSFGAAGPPEHLVLQRLRDLSRKRDPGRWLWGPTLQMLDPRKQLSPAGIAMAMGRAALGRRAPVTTLVREFRDLAGRERAYGAVRGEARGPARQTATLEPAVAR